MLRCPAAGAEDWGNSETRHSDSMQSTSLDLVCMVPEVCNPGHSTVLGKEQALKVFTEMDSASSGSLPKFRLVTLKNFLIRDFICAKFDFWLVSKEMIVLKLKSYHSKDTSPI